MKINHNIKLSDKITGSSPLLNKLIDKNAQIVIVGRSSQLGRYSIEATENNNIIMPQDLKSYRLAIQENDFNYELFADGYSNYIGEPLFLCYSNNKDDALEKLNLVKINYESNIQDERYKEIEEHSEILLNKEFKQGKTDYSSDELFCCNYQSSSEDVNRFYQSGAYVHFEDDRLIIHTSTLWSHFIQKTVAKMLNIDEDKIAVRNYAQGQSLSLDLIDSIFYSCYVAIVAYKTKKSSYFLLNKEDDFYFSPKRNVVKANYQAKLSTTNGFEFFRAIIQINIGSQAILAEETLNKIAVRLLGDPYAKENYHISIELIKTNTPPAFALSTLGESSLFFTLETFINQFLDHFNLPIITGRARLYYQSNQTNALNYSSKIPSVLSLLSLNVLKESSFDKKYLAYKFLPQKKLIKHNYPILNAKGIGFAHGALGGHFLSTNLRKTSITMILHDEDNIELQTSVSLSQIMILKEWQTIISDELMIPLNNITFTISDTDSTPDSGPIMEDFFNIVSNLICQALLKFKNLDRKDIKYPYKIVQNFEENPLWDNQKLQGKPYLMESAISTVVEIDFDFCSFNAKIRHLYFSISCAKILNRTILLNHLETEILHTIDWIMNEKPYFLHGKIPSNIFKANLAKKPSHLPTYSIIIEENEDLNHDDFTYGFYGGLINSTLPAAYLHAINQVLNLNLTELPKNQKDLFDIYNKKFNVINSYENKKDDHSAFKINEIKNMESET